MCVVCARAYTSVYAQVGTCRSLKHVYLKKKTDKFLFIYFVVRYTRFKWASISDIHFRNIQLEYFSLSLIILKSVIRKYFSN